MEEGEKMNTENELSNKTLTEITNGTLDVTEDICEVLKSLNNSIDLLEKRILRVEAEMRMKND